MDKEDINFLLMAGGILLAFLGAAFLCSLVLDMSVSNNLDNYFFLPWYVTLLLIVVITELLFWFDLFQENRPKEDEIFFETLKFKAGYFIVATLFLFGVYCCISLGKVMILHWKPFLIWTGIIAAGIGVFALYIHLNSYKYRRGM